MTIQEKYLQLISRKVNSSTIQCVSKKEKGKDKNQRAKSMETIRRKEKSPLSIQKNACFQSSEDKLKLPLGT